ncbi:MAG: LysM peptidoglycan-binding domain-containing protein [Anaerolineae bacterium]|nr:LysM peptidoglycan-binding domain-containing protein [Anaerolineae bacterium]
MYIVVPGDTLSSIAQRVASSASVLAQANCLSNPNLITPGQPLRVPRLPDPDSQAGTIQVSPFLIAEGGSFTVSANTPVTVSWPQARRDAIRVEFYASPLITNPPSTLLGVDNSPADGASIPVTFPLNFQQAVHAIAYLPSGSRQLTANRIPVFAVDSGQNPPPAFQPNLGKEGDITVLPYGSITTTWNPSALAQATYVDFTLIRFGTQRQFLGRDSNMADGAQFTWAGGDAGPTGIHQFEVVAYRGSGILATNTVRIRFQVVPQVQGDVIINPTLRTEGDIQIVQAGATVTLTWQNAPVGQSPQFEFTLYEDGIVGPRSIGIDSNGADGVSVPWTVPSALNNGRIVASARLPIQTGQTIESRPVRVRPESVNPKPGPVGQLVLSPIVREDGGWQVVQTGAAVTLTWASAPTANVQSVEFYLTPTGTGMSPQLIGTDSSPADGASYVWTVPGGLSGYLSAIAFTTEGREIVPINNNVNVYSE